MGYADFWKRLSPWQLGFAIQAFSLIAIFFEGYDQGVMGGVNASPNYVQEVGIGLADGTVTDTVHQGGIVSIYYLGAIVGCFAGGWLADRRGRINGILVGAVLACIGGALQAAATSSAFILVARVVTGLGTGALTGIVPVYCSEISGAQERGRFLGLVFIANYLGISVAYWLAFGLAFVKGDNGLEGYSAVRWRFPLAFQCLPAILLVLFIKMLPDSPRYLMSVGRSEEAREVLQQVRGGDNIEVEYAEMATAAKTAHASSPVEFVKILAGRSAAAGTPHIGRRAWLCIWLQLMASWTGITAVTAYSPVLLSQAGYSSIKQNGLAGGLNTIGIVGTIISAFIVDKIGRRKCLMGGAAGLAAVNIIAASLYEGSRVNPAKASSIAPAAVAMLFLFNLIYAATWGTIAFLLPTEFFPAHLRAQGNGFGITGWALGVGMTVLVNPIMFQVLKSRTYFLFGGLNLLWIGVVYYLYPETKDRSLEAISMYLFTSASPTYKASERAWRAHGNGDIIPDTQLGSRETLGEKVSHSSSHIA